ncbi:MAG: hypothetical protein LBH06_02645 [Rikenellaceae bacterium]|jgi:hypothetical protein|nr:hypothetical protein [Rikenellaceae bacterium]
MFRLDVGEFYTLANESANFGKRIVQKIFFDGLPTRRPQECKTAARIIFEQQFFTGRESYSIRSSMLTMFVLIFCLLRCRTTFRMADMAARGHESGSDDLTDRVLKAPSPADGQLVQM